MAVKFRYLVTFLLIFVLIYFEQSYIGPIKLSLWKLPVVFLLMVYVLNSRLRWSPLFLFGFFLAAKLLFNEFMFYGTETVNEAVYVLIFPLTSIFFYSRFYQKQHVIKNILIATSIFFLVSALPFILKIIPQSRVLTVYEADNVDALVGIFYHMATSSQVFAVSTIVILFSRRYFSEKKLDVVWWFLVIYGTYCVFLAFTRTGWILLFIGILCYLYNVLGKSKFLFFSFAATIVIAVSTTAIMASIDRNSVFYKRLIGESSNNTNEDIDLNTLSSGRLGIYEVSINGVLEGGMGSILLGIGKDYSTHKTEIKMGTGYAAHNRFIEIFCYGGLIALSIFLFYLAEVKRLVFLLERSNSYGSLALTLFVIMVVSLFPSHGFNMYSDFLFGLVLAGGFIEKHSEEDIVLSKEVVK